MKQEPFDDEVLDELEVIEDLELVVDEDEIGFAKDSTEPLMELVPLEEDDDDEIRLAPLEEETVAGQIGKPCPKCAKATTPGVLTCGYCGHKMWGAKAPVSKAQGLIHNPPEPELTVSSEDNTSEVVDTALTVMKIGLTIVTGL